MNTGFAAGTLVHTDCGVLPIEHLRVGDLVLSLPVGDAASASAREAGAPRYRRILGIEDLEVQAAVRVPVTHPASGTADMLVLGADQAVWTRQADWVAAGQLRMGHTAALSFASDALVGLAKPVAGAHSLYRLAIEEDDACHVGRLGVRVAGSTHAGAREAAPGPAVQKVDLARLTRPVTLLAVEDFHNGIMPVRTPSADERAKLLTLAQRVRSKVQEQLGVTLGYDRQGVRWLEEYLGRRAAGNAPGQDQVQALGAYFGQCLVTWQGGEWAVHGEQLAVQFPSGMLLFPMVMVAKRLQGPGPSLVSAFASAGAAASGGPVATAPAGSHRLRALAAQAEMERMLAIVRASCAQAQSRLDAPTLAALRAQPTWMSPRDGLYPVYEAQELLITQGSVVWAAMVQANQLLFEPGPDDCPAQLVYSTHHHFDARPGELESIAGRLADLKGTAPGDPVLGRLADLVTDETNRSMSLELPPVFSDYPICLGAFMVFRKHVPGGVLGRFTFPLLVHPATPAVMIVPSGFWPPELIALWKRGLLATALPEP